MKNTEIKNTEIKNAKISIIVVIYQVEAYLEKCLESLRNQTYEDIEILLSVSDSDSTCMEICQKYKALDSRFLIVERQKKDVAEARNCGLKAVSGEYFAFVDGDDWVAPTYIEDLYDSIRESNADLSICAFHRVYSENPISVISNLPVNMPIDVKEIYKEILLYKSFGLEIWDKLYISNKVKDIPFLEVEAAEDRFWLNDVLSNLKTVSYTNKADYYYRIRKDGLSHHKENARLSFESDRTFVETILSKYKDFEAEANLFLFLSKYRVFYEMIHIEKNRNKAQLKECYIQLKEYAPKAKSACIRKPDKIKIHMAMSGFEILKLFVFISGLRR